MVILTMRKSARLVAEKEERKDGPKPVSMVGGGRGSALIAFTEATMVGR